MSERLLVWLTISFIALTSAILAAAILIPSFVDSGGATIAGILLGAYTSLLLGAGVGAGVTRSVRKENERD